MSIQKRAKLVPWIAGFAVLALVAILAVPGFAASTVQKQASLDVVGPLGQSGDKVSSLTGPGSLKLFKATISNKTPGNSNFNSAAITVPTCSPGPCTSSNQNIYVSNATVSSVASESNNGTNSKVTLWWMDSTGTARCSFGSGVTACAALPSGSPAQQGKVYVLNLDPVKSTATGGSKVTINITMTYPTPTTCTNATTAPDWYADVRSGGNLSGDVFILNGTGYLNSGLKTLINPQCGSLAITKYGDTNTNNTRDQDQGEQTLTDPGAWQFTIFAASDTAHANALATGTTDASGSVTFTLPVGSYEACETDSRIDPNSSDYSAAAPWTPSPPEGCISVSPSSTSTPTPYDFGNSQGNLDCLAELTSTGTVLTRLNNTDDSDCYLKPATLTSSFTSDGDNVTFLVTGSQKASYEFQIQWGPTAKPADPTQIPNAPTTVDLKIVDGGLVTDVHNMQWCLPDNSVDIDPGTLGNQFDSNLKPDLPSGEVACLENEVWTISPTNSTQLLKTDTIYAEADLTLKCSTCK